MYGTILAIHVLVAILLIVVILIQRGRGGGLVESFSGMESMFGTRTSQFLTRTTAVLATIFLLTSISLALLAAGHSRSLIREEAASPLQETIKIPAVDSELPAETPELPTVEPEETKAESGAPVVQEEPFQKQVVQEEAITE